ncbi:MAG: secretin N-terminal domain-containing protein [Deinococcales bacterium]
MKTFLTLALSFGLWFGLALAQQATTQGPTITELAPLPADPRFNQVISFNTGLSGAALPTVIEALAQAVGLTAVIEDVPNSLEPYNLGEKPFRQIWQIVLSLNGLDYKLMANDVVIVGSAEAIARFNQREPVVDPQISQRFYKVSGNAEDFAAALRAAVPEAIVEPIANINTLSVRATLAQHVVVQTALLELDPPITETPKVEEDSKITIIPREQRIYRLSNADAEEIAAILQDTGVLITEETAGVVNNADGTSETASNTTKTERDFLIVADKRTNSLIINATLEQHAQFVEIIPQLDIPQKQVNVQIRIQEIKKESANKLGIDLNTGFGNFSAKLLDTGLSFIFDAQKAVSGLNIGAVLDTYERQGLSRRVDDANITALNNGEATMQAGGVITIVGTGSSEGNTLNSLEVPYGVRVIVQPRIANDGRIIMKVQASVEDLRSTIDDARVHRTTNNVESTITLEPGQTIMLGGLFQNKFKESVNGIPVLSSLPLIGAAFNTTTIEEDESELLLIVTANVID